MTVLRQLRKLVLGETWRLPVGITVAVLVAAAVRVAAGPDGWWREAGGFLLLGLLLAALVAAVRVR
jgi:hypothetical protein